MLDYKFIIFSFIIKFCQCNEYLLPKIVTPEKYDLRILSTLHEDGPNDFTFKGQVNIEVICNKESNNITLHSHELGIKKKIIVRNIQTNKTIKVTKFDMNPKYQFLHLYLKDPIEVSEKYRIRIQFIGNMSKSQSGFYRSSFKNLENNETTWLALTQFEPTNARRAFPCFDEPAYKARFNIRLGHNKNLVALSNMPLKYTKKMLKRKNYVLERFQETEIMSTYLVAYMICDFGHITFPREISNPSFNFWARESALSQATFAQTTGRQALSLFDKYFKITYPLPKLDMVAIPEYEAGAKNNWGLITFSESALLYDEQISNKNNKEKVATVICHEIAHQWFGNLVTMEWWNDTWLNEGLATYLSLMCVEHLFPELNYEIRESMLSMKTVFDKDGLESSVPLSSDVVNPDDIENLFGVLDYLKGSAIMRMIEKFLGNKVFRTGLINYINKHRFGNAKQEDLWNALTEEAQKVESLPNNLTVNKIMDSWTFQSGYPIVNIHRNYRTGLVEVRQERFLETTNVRYEGDENNCWWIPFTYTTADVKDFNNTTPQLWLPCPRTTFTFKYKQSKNWIIGNIQQSGLYRLNYDEKNWKLIIKHLKYDNIEDICEENRVALIGDVMALADLNILEFSLAFDLLQYLQREEKATPWDVALQFLKKINQIFVGSFHERHLMTAYMQRILKPMYIKFGGFHVEGDKVSDLHKLIVVEACAHNVDVCEDDALKLFQDASPINKEFIATVFCTVINLGGQEEWDFFWQEYLDSNTGVERTMLLEAMACSKKKNILRKYIQFILEDNPNAVGKQDGQIIFTAIANNIDGYEIAKSFLYKNGPEIVAQVNSEHLGNYILSIGDKIADEDEFETLKEFLVDNPEFRQHANLAVQQAIETIELNIRRKNIHFAAIVDEI